MTLKRQIENPKMLRLRFKYEPYSLENIKCTYKSGCFILQVNNCGHRMRCYDRRSLSNRQAVKSLRDLLKL